MRIVLVSLGLLLLLTACGGNAPSTVVYADMPQTGDVSNGEMLFTAQGCTACHHATASGAPTLDGFGDYAGSVVDGQTGHEYAFYSIVEPARYIAEGYGNAMPNRYDEAMTAQEIADLIAYLLSR